MYRQVLYISAVARYVVTGQLTQLLAEAQANNRRNGITGVLLYTGEAFLQILEGEEPAVSETLSRIGADPRHQQMLTLYDHMVDRRSFGDWSMGFRTIEPEWSHAGNMFRLTRDALAERVKAGDSGTLKTLLDTFCEIELGTAA